MLPVAANRLGFQRRRSESIRRSMSVCPINSSGTGSSLLNRSGRSISYRRNVLLIGSSPQRCECDSFHRQWPRAASGTRVSPFAQVLNEKRPARKPSARRSVAESGKRILIIWSPDPFYAKEPIIPTQSPVFDYLHRSDGNRRTRAGVRGRLPKRAPVTMHPALDAGGCRILPGVTYARSTIAALGGTLCGAGNQSRSRLGLTTARRVAVMRGIGNCLFIVGCAYLGLWICLRHLTQDSDAQTTAYMVGAALLTCLLPALVLRISARVAAKGHRVVCRLMATSSEAMDSPLPIGGSQST